MRYQTGIHKLLVAAAVVGILSMSSCASGREGPINRNHQVVYKLVFALTTSGGEGDTDLWIDSMGTLSRLTRDGRKTMERIPRFIDAADISYVANDVAIIRKSLTDESQREVLASRGIIESYDWSPDRSKIALITANDQHEDILSIVDVRSGSESRLRKLGTQKGELGALDEISVTWSPSGTMLLVIDTSMAPRATGLILNAPKGDVRREFNGTQAVWARRANDVYFLSYGTSRNQWMRLSATGRNHPAAIDVPPDARDLMPSPNGDMVAYDIERGSIEPNLYLLDLHRMTTNEVLAHALAPLWVGPQKVIATLARKCSADECLLSPWAMGETTSVKDLVSNQTTTLAGSSTRDAAVWVDNSA